jgi:hypothetical protein
MGDESAQDLTIRLNIDRSQAKAENRAAAADNRRLEKEVLSDAEATERARDGLSRTRHAAARRAARETADEEARATRRARDELGRFVSEGVAGHRKMEDAARKSATGQAASFAIAQAGLQKLIDLAGAYGQAVTDAGRKSRQLTSGFGDQRDQLRELAVLMGKEADNAFTLDFARFNRTTGFRPEEGLGFLTELYNSGAQYEGKTISQAEMAQYREQVGRLAVAKQIEPSVAGDVAGSLLGFTDYTKFGDQASEQALGRLNASLAILGRGKGNNAVLARQFSMLSSAALNEEAMKGVFQSPEEVAAVVSAGAEKHDAQAAEMARAAIRGMRDFSDKDAGGLLKRAGIDPTTAFIPAIEKLAPVVLGEAQAKGLKTEDVLAQYFKDTLTREAIGTYINKGVGGGIFADRLAFGAQNAGPAAALGTIDQFRRSEAGMRREADADVRLAEMERGAENSGLEVVRRQALARLVRRKEIDTNATNLKDYLVGKTSFGVLGEPEQLRIDEETQRLLRERTPAGVAAPPLSDLLNVSPLAREEDLRNRMGRIRAAGGNPFEPTPALAAPAPGQAPPAAADNSAVVEILRSINDGINRLFHQKPPPRPPAPMPGAPRQP